MALKSKFIKKILNPRSSEFIFIKVNRRLYILYYVYQQMILNNCTVIVIKIKEFLTNKNNSPNEFSKECYNQLSRDLDIICCRYYSTLEYKLFT